MRRAIRIATVVLVLALPAPAAAAIPSLRFYDSGIWAGVSDGERYLAYPTAARSLRIVDTRQRTRTDIASPCEPIFAAHAYALTAGCDPSEPWRRAVMSLAHHDFTFLPQRFPDEIQYGGIGRYWVSATQCDPHCGSHFYNWRTGETRYASPPRDLDLRSLPPFDELTHDFLRYARGRRYLYIDPKGVSTPPVLLTRFLAPCPPSCDLPTVSARRVTWRQGTLLRANIIPTRRRCTWRIPKPPDADVTYSLVTAHTRERVFAFAIPQDRSQPTRIYSAYFAC
jgi:hypothetical protein